MHQIPNWEEEKKNGKKKDLEAINGEKTTEDAFLETSTQYYHIILFIHDSEDRHCFLSWWGLGLELKVTGEEEIRMARQLLRQ
jgi:hypothetical protein